TRLHHVSVYKPFFLWTAIRSLSPSSLSPPRGPMALRSFSPAASARSVHPSLTAASLLPSRTGSIVRAPGNIHGGNISLGKHMSSLSSSSNYVRLQEGVNAFFSSLLVSRNSKRRARVIRCATIEEIEAEKSVIEKDAKERMEKTIETVRASFNAVRTGRANPSMLDRVEVEYYGSPVSLKSIAQISTPDGSTLLVQPYDKSSLKAVEKAIVSSDIGLTPNNDGEVIRLSIPQLTSERRKELSKVVAKLTEEGKVAVRNIRRDAIKAYEKLEKEKKLSEDIVKDLSSDLQKVTDEYMKKIETIQKQKEKVCSLKIVGIKFYSNGNGSGLLGDGRRKSCWYEEEIEQNLRWCFALNSILHTGSSQYQDIALLDTKPFGKALVLDGKLQSAEMDEFIYHESLVHPALLHHQNPKHIFIMGGGEGSTAREILRHRTVERVVMCDIDQEVVDFCKSHLLANKEAFFDPRLHVVINDARAELEKRKDKFDVIVGDLADPIEGGPCYKLYTKSFYEETLKPRLNQGGIFVTQAGPAGVFSHTEVFSCIYNTLRHVFRYVVPYSAHIPSYADTWGWVMASDSPFTLDAEKLDSRIRQRIEGENRYVDGETFASASILSKAVRKSLAKETQLYTEGTAKFIYGHGNCTNIAST
ncbi:unnamed protein product, partial [Musa acuminata subsp. burmannicoides]